MMALRRGIVSMDGDDLPLALLIRPFTQVTGYSAASSVRGHTTKIRDDEVVWMNCGSPPAFAPDWTAPGA